jgi:alanyl aminopeptidase
VLPTAYRAELTVDPAKPTFRGTADIEVTVEHPTPVIWLNAQELHIERAKLTQAGRTLEATALPQPKDFVGLRFEQALRVGPSTLHVEYSGTLSDRNFDGVSRQEEGGAWYVFTSFEPSDARRAFPSFDEPSFKIPWELSLVVPNDDGAFSNMNAVATVPVDPGHRRVTFARTPPLPSYLVAFAVGPLDIVDAGKSKGGVPVRVLTPHGKQAEARLAAASGAETLSKLEAFFGFPCPYQKIDLVAVPHFQGAMENPGLLTFDEGILLAKPEHESIQLRRHLTSVVAHELSHQWFGDYVTPAWWDDLWLNESFATWMATKLLSEWQPTWSSEEQVRSAAKAMHEDSLVSARKIRQPIQSDDDMQNAFDAITYEKGAAVIRMFEAWAGPDGFRRGVRRFLQEHAHSNGNAQQFLEAVSRESGKDLAPGFLSFLDQPGLPLVSFTLECKGSTSSIQLSQQRYLTRGGAIDAAQSHWRLPVCVRWHSAQEKGEDCTLLTGAQGTLDLHAKQCPAWVMPNPGRAGYYRVAFRPSDLNALLAKGAPDLSPAERMGILDDISAGIAAGRLSFTDALSFLPEFANDPNDEVIESTTGMARRLRELAPPELEPNLSRYLRRLFGTQARRLGWVPKVGEPDERRLLRASLLPLVAELGHDEALAKEAARLARTWLHDHRSVAPETVDSVLSVAAAKGDLAFFRELLAAAVKEPDPTERHRILHALTELQDPASVQASLALTLASPFDAREVTGLLFSGLTSPKTRALSYEFMKQHYEELSKRLPMRDPANFPMLGARQCDDRYRDDMEAFFKERASRVEGGPRLLAQALEALEQCVAYRRAEGPGVAAFLSKQ